MGLVCGVIAGSEGETLEGQQPAKGGPGHSDGRMERQKGYPSARDEARNAGLPASGCLSSKCS